MASNVEEKVRMLSALERMAEDRLHQLRTDKSPLAAPLARDLDHMHYLRSRAEQVLVDLVGEYC